MEELFNMDEQLLQKIASAAATWKHVGEGIESKPLVTFAEYIEALLKGNVVARERLAKSMDREAALKADNDRLAKENKQLADTLARYDAHPEVRAAKRNAIAEQLRRLQSQAESLKDPE